MRVFNELFIKNRFKTNIECLFKQSFVCSVLQHPLFSQEILGEERIRTGSHAEKSALCEGLVESTQANEKEKKSMISASKAFQEGLIASRKKSMPFENKLSYFLYSIFITS